MPNKTYNITVNVHRSSYEDTTGKRVRGSLRVRRFTTSIWKVERRTRVTRDANYFKNTIPRVSQNSKVQMNLNIWTTIAPINSRACHGEKPSAIEDTVTSMIRETHEQVEMSLQNVASQITPRNVKYVNQFEYKFSQTKPWLFQG